MSNTKYNSGDSQYEDDEVESVVEETEDGEDPNNRENRGKPRVSLHDFKDSDPEV